MAEHAMESKLRPAVELYTVAICVAAAVLCVYSPWAVALSPEIGLIAALAYALFGLIRLRQAWEVLRYPRWQDPARRGLHHSRHSSHRT